MLILLNEIVIDNEYYCTILAASSHYSLACKVYHYATHARYIQQALTEC